MTSVYKGPHVYAREHNATHAIAQLSIVNKKQE